MSHLSLVDRLPDAEAKTSAIGHLQEALDRVNSGETVSVALVEVSRDGGTYTHWSVSANCNIILGGLTRLAQKIGKAMEG